MNTGIHELLSLSNLQLCPSGGVGCCAKSLVVPGSQHTCHVVGEHSALMEYFPWSLQNMQLFRASLTNSRSLVLS